MPSVMGMLEARESAARVRVEELRAEADRVRAELAEAEAVLERRVVALRELAEALAAGAVPQEPVRPAPVPHPRAVQEALPPCPASRKSPARVAALEPTLTTIGTTTASFTEAER